MAEVDGLRAVAALWITALHAMAGFLPHWHTGPIPFLVSAGAVGVPMFLVLSGFCLAYPLLVKGHTRVGLRSFAIRRTLRILPPYYIVMISLAALQQLSFVAQRTAGEVTDLPDFLTHLFMVHNLWPDHIVRLSGPFWSIALETQFYLLFPLIFLVMKRPWVPLVGSLALAAGWWLAAPTLLGPVPADAVLGTNEGNAAFAYWNSLPSLLPLFLFGMVAAGMIARSRRIPAWVKPTACVLFVASLFAQNWVAWPIPAKLLAAGATALFLLAPGGRLGRVLSCKPLIRLGEASFTLYLTHVPVMRAIQALVAGRLRGPGLVVVTVAAMAVAVAVALIASKVIERPFHRLARRLAGPSRAVSGL